MLHIPKGPVKYNILLRRLSESKSSVPGGLWTYDVLIMRQVLCFNCYPLNKSTSAHFKEVFCKKNWQKKFYTRAWIRSKSEGPVSTKFRSSLEFHLGWIPPTSGTSSRCPWPTWSPSGSPSPWPGGNPGWGLAGTRNDPTAAGTPGQDSGASPHTWWCRSPPRPMGMHEGSVL